MTYYRIICVFLIGLFIACNSKQEQKKPEKELASIDVPKVVTADIEAGIEANIAAKVEEGEGYFILDSLKLQLVRVHTEYLSNLGPRRHFACVDLADISGDIFS